ncbi:asparagine synthase (glutamine-hydrolyzing) [Azospirillum sp. CT11-132]|uniref:asparagine synthase (glutamine-hydrolyzing) n=1 Tax=Azospirillum sp. CT11-132 TaxID=3396317 RepID=UPI0039A6174C
MCGIAGILNGQDLPISPATLRGMTNAMFHRGPDAGGWWAEGGIGLGHRRLSIIDLSPKGRQPMATQDGRFVMTYNGEIYNFADLRRELVGLGWTFRSQTDSEVLLNGFAAWGASLLDRLNGMFAFAIWDRRDRRLFLARDRYGIKPLYYASVNGQFLFASEAKAFLAVPDFPRRMNVAGLFEYFNFQNFFTDQTLVENVRMLPAGCWMEISGAGGGLSEPRLHRYWDFHFDEPETTRSPEDYLEELDHLFRQAVSRQMVSDVEVGAYLSGGLDSGAITALASRQVPLLRTFTCGFDLRNASGIELNYDERAAAEHMSYVFKTEHYEMVLKSGDMERVLPRVTWHLDEPRVGQSYPNYCISRLAGKFVKVVLAGTGGDELFGGYPWRYYRAPPGTGFEQFLMEYHTYWQRLVPAEQMKPLFRPIQGAVGDLNSFEIFKGIFPEHAPRGTRPEDQVNNSLYLEAKTFLHGLLTVEDKLSMAHSLETRVPFLDNDLVDFAMALPASLKLRRFAETVRLNENEPGAKSALYFQKTRDGKLLLRNLMERYVPREVVEREKQGFSAPDASWFRGESIDYVRRLLLGKEARIFDYLDRTVIRGLVDDHLSGRTNRRLLIWSLLSMENWIEMFLTASGTTEKETANHSAEDWQADAVIIPGGETFAGQSPCHALASST